MPAKKATTIDSEIKLLEKAAAKSKSLKSPLAKLTTALKALKKWTPETTKTASKNLAQSLITAFSVDAVPLYNALPEQTLAVAAALTSAVYGTQLAHHLSKSSAESYLDGDQMLWEDVIDLGILAGVSEIINCKPDDPKFRRLVGEKLYHILSPMLYQRSSGKLGLTLRTQICALLTDSARNEKDNKARLLDSKILGAVRVGEMIAHANDYRYCTALMELVSRLLPRKTDKKGRGAVCRDLFENTTSLDVFGSTTAKTLSKLLTDGDDSKYSETVARMQKEMGKACGDKATAFDVADCRLDGRQFRLQTTPYIFVSHSALMLSPDDEDYVDVDLGTITRIHLSQPVEADIRVAMSLSRPPLSPTTDASKASLLEFSLPQSAAGAFRTLLDSLSLTSKILPGSKMAPSFKASQLGREQSILHVGSPRKARHIQTLTVIDSDDDDLPVVELFQAIEEDASAPIGIAMKPVSKPSAPPPPQPAMDSDSELSDVPDLPLPKGKKTTGATRRIVSPPDSPSTPVSPLAPKPAGARPLRPRRAPSPAAPKRPRGLKRALDVDVQDENLIQAGISPTKKARKEKDLLITDITNAPKNPTGLQSKAQTHRNKAEAKAVDSPPENKGPDPVRTVQAIPQSSKPKPKPKPKAKPIPPSKVPKEVPVEKRQSPRLETTKPSKPFPHQALAAESSFPDEKVAKHSKGPSKHQEEPASDVFAMQSSPPTAFLKKASAMPWLQSSGKPTVDNLMRSDHQQERQQMVASPVRRPAEANHRSPVRPSSIAPMPLGQSRPEGLNKPQQISVRTRPAPGSDEPDYEIIDDPDMTLLDVSNADLKPVLSRPLQEGPLHMYLKSEKTDRDLVQPRERALKVTPVLQTASTNLASATLVRPPRADVHSIPKIKALFPDATVEQNVLELTAVKEDVHEDEDLLEICEIVTKLSKHITQKVKASFDGVDAGINASKNILLQIARDDLERLLIASQEYHRQGQEFNKQVSLRRDASQQGFVTVRHGEAKLGVLLNQTIRNHDARMTKWLQARSRPLFS